LFSKIYNTVFRFHAKETISNNKSVVSKAALLPVVRGFYYGMIAWRIGPQGPESPLLFS
jgi:hypothetical protein